MIFIHITNDDLTVHRISAANFTHIRTFNTNESLERIFDDRQDWQGYNVNIFARSRHYPYSAVVDDVLVGVDVEACKAIFEHGNMSYKFVVLPHYSSLDHIMLRKAVDELLDSAFIHVIAGRVGTASPYGQTVVVRDTDGVCLMVPRRHQRNFIYHLVHPFELDTWMVVAFVLVLDMILGVCFPIAFPHNLIMILLFGDSLADHEQTRWTRFYCFTCTVLLFLLSEAYLAKAIIYMTMTRYAPDMKTIAEFVASDFPILIDTGVMSSFNESETMSKLLSKTVEDPNFYFHMDSSVYAYMVACGLGRRLVDRQVIDNYIKHGREGKRRFYLVKERIMWYYHDMVVQYQFMYYARFREMVEWLGDAGLWDKWINDLHENEERYSQYELRDEDDILFLEDLAAVWYLVLVGWTISGMTILLEMAWNYFKRNYKKCGQCLMLS
ncbi:hypothetical protein RP20_CCG006904 [Aedes albopictus]|nr:hypothetical protein RP20_CCG006904 [Aedes albopictus]